MWLVSPLQWLLYSNLKWHDFSFLFIVAVQYSSYADTPVNVTVSMGILSIATNILRILRNMCSQSPSNQQVVLSSGMIRCVPLFPVSNLDLGFMHGQTLMGIRRDGVVRMVWTFLASCSSTNLQCDCWSWFCDSQSCLGVLHPWLFSVLFVISYSLDFWWNNIHIT